MSPRHDRVLVVDRSPERRGLIARALEPDGCEVVTADDEEEGLALACVAFPDLVISAPLTQRAGELWLAMLRRVPALDRVPVLVVTAAHDREMRERLLTRGAQDYVIEPCAPAELRARVGLWLAQKRTRETLERALGRRAGDVAALCETLAIARDQADQASQAKSAFLAAVAHDLLTPLATIRLQLEQLERMGVGRAHPVAIERLNRSGDRLHALVESVIDFVQLENGTLQLQLADIDVHRAVLDIVRGLAPRAERKDLALTLTCDPEVTSFACDPRLFALGVRHLIDNAIRTTVRGEVHVDVSVADAELDVQVDERGGDLNDGPATPPEADELAREREAAFAHGLALVRQFSRALGGRVQVRTGPGFAHTCVLRLPSYTRHS